MKIGKVTITNRIVQLALICSISASFGLAHAATEITLDNMTGLHSGDSVIMDESVRWEFRFTYTPGDGSVIGGSTNGFEVYTHLGGAYTDNFTAIVYDTFPWGWPDLYDLTGGLVLSDFSVDGVGADTVGFGGAKLFDPGIVDGTDSLCWWIETTPSTDSDTLCIDSAYYPPAGEWFWSTKGPLGNFVPDWGGPYCFHVHDTTTPVNNPPVLAPIGPQSTTENVQLTFGVSASDVESIPTLTTSTLPGGANFIDNGDGTGEFDWTPDYTQSGPHYVTFYATDDSSAVVSEVVTITVNEAGNQAPVLAAIGNQNTTEGVLLTFGVLASDAESIPTLTTSTLPGSANFIDNGDGTGDFNWTPGYTDAGTYFVTFYAIDDSLAVDSEVVQIDVAEAGNQRPVLDSIGPQEVNEGEQLILLVTSSDPDGDSIILTTDTLYDGMSFTDHGYDTATFDWTPNFDQAGVYYVNFIASDGELADLEVVEITVNNVNRPPALDSIGPKMFNEGNTLTFTVTASDPDETTPSLSEENLPIGADFTDNGDGTGDFTWAPNFDQADVYYVTFIASDGELADSEVVEITVDNVNRLPEIDPVADTTIIDECDTLEIAFSATDPDGDSIALWLDTLYENMSFTDNGDGSADLYFAPSFDHAGTYPLTLYAADSLDITTVMFTITVEECYILVLAPQVLNFSAVEGYFDPADQTFDIDSDGDPLDFTLSNDSAWLSTVPSSGTTDAAITVSIDITGLVAGTYLDTIVVESETAGNSPQYVEVNLVIEEPPPSLVVSPQVLNFSAFKGFSSPADQTFDIDSDGDPLDFTLSNDSAWLSTVPSSGTTDATITVSVGITGLEAGTYHDTIVVESETAGNSPQFAYITLEVIDDYMLHVPSEYPTIQEAIDASADGDTILIAPGTYTGDGNRDLYVHEWQIVLKSESGPENTIIDCEGSSDDPHRALYLDYYSSSENVVDGFTFRGGYSGEGSGAGIYMDMVGPTIRNCVFENNVGGAMSCWFASPLVTNCKFIGNTYYSGGALYCYSSSPTLTGCLFDGNSAQQGGAIYYSDGSSALLTNCTFVNNSANYGSGIYFDTIYYSGDAIGTSLISNCIFAFGANGEAIFVSPGNSLSLFCSDIYGNAGGDWVGYIADQEGVNGNFSDDPLFCDFANGDYQITENSPCTQSNSGCEPFVGSYGVGCGAIQIALLPTSIDFSATEGEGNPPPDTLVITNTGGGMLICMLSPSALWLSLSDTVVTAPWAVTVSADISGLTAGVYTDTIIVIAEDAVNSPQHVPVTLTVQIAGEIALSPDSIAFSADSGGANPDPQILTITNAGGGTLNWEVHKNTDWLIFSDSIGTAPSTVTVSADITDLSPGPYFDTVTVFSDNAANSPQYVPVTLTVQAVPEISRSPDSMSFSSDSGSANPEPQNLTITNTGGGTLNWELSKNKSWLSLSDIIGTAPSTVTVSVDITDLSPDDYFDTITVFSDNAVNSPQYVPVTLTIDTANRPPEFVGICNDTVLVEGQKFECEVVISDPDGDPIDFSCQQCPAGAELTSPGDTTALFSFEPDYRHVDSSYTVIIEASDGVITVSNSFTISVVNRQLEVINIQPHSGEGQDILISWKPIQIQFNEALQASSLETGLTITSRKGDLLSHTYDAGQYLLTFDNTTDYLMDLDTIICTLRTSILDMAENPLDSEYVYAFYTGVAVFPGDANDDDIVDERDILPMGLYWGNAGPSRPDSGDISWGIKPAHVYTSGNRWTPLASVYADADGSGQVNANDICGVTNNWAQQVISGKRAGQGDKTGFEIALKQFEGNVLQQMYEALANCPESEGKASVMKMFESLLDEPATNLPTTYNLSQNYPNPFNPYTAIQFYLPQSGHVTLSVYNIMGQKVAVLLDGYMDKGYGEVTWDGADQSGRLAASGIYFYRLEGGEVSITKRMMLLK